MPLEQENVPIDWSSGIYDFGVRDEYPHELLTDFIGQCINGDANDVRVFVPSCGKSTGDIRLYEEGYLVYGIDGNEKALQKAFIRLGLKYTYSRGPDGFGLFESLDQRIKLFCGELSQFTKHASGCLFDVIWDRSGFAAVREEEREGYINGLCDLLLPTGRVLLAACILDSSKSKDSHFVIKREDIHSYFGRNFHVNSLKTHDGRRGQWQSDLPKETGFMLSLKT